MNKKITVSLISLGLFLSVCFVMADTEELSETKTISFTKDVVVKRYKKGEVKAEPYTVVKGDNLWKILVKKYGIKERQFYFFCRITKSLNPGIENAHKIAPDQIFLIPFKYVVHFNVPEEGYNTVLLDILSAPPSQVHTEEYIFSEGEHLAQVLRDMYDIPDELIFDRYLNLVKKLNPDLQDLNQVKPDQKIILPSLASSTLPPEEKVKPEEAITAEKVQKEEAAVAEEIPSIVQVPEEEGIKGEVLAEKKIEPVYRDPRFRKIAGRIPSGKTSYRDYVGSIADVLQGKLNSFGALTIPLMEEGKITIDTDSFPILQLTDKKKMILNYGNKIPDEVIELLQSESGDFGVVTLRENEAIESVLDKIVDAAGYFSVDKSRNPLVIGDKIQFEIAGDWVIYKDDLLKDVVVVNLIEEGGKPLNSQLKDLIHNYGVNLIDLYKTGEGEQEPVDFTQKTAESAGDPADAPFLDTSDPMALVDSLLALLGQDFQKDNKVELFQGESGGFDVEIVADRYFERMGNRYIISFHSISSSLMEVITQQGYHFLNLSKPLKDSSAIVESALDLLDVRYDSPLPRFSDRPEGERNLEIFIPGILIMQDETTKILLTALELKVEVYQWLIANEIKVVRLGSPS